MSIAASMKRTSRFFLQHHIYSISVLLVGLNPMNGLNAQEVGANDFVLEEVVVVARRRAENLQVTPISATVISSDDIEKFNLRDLTQIDQVAPNVAINTSGLGSTSRMFIRGVGQFDNVITTDPGVGLYVDGVYMARAFGNSLDFMELERIEVLRGPQGTLFGKNTIGGAIQLITKKPADEFKASGGLTYGRYDRIEIRASVDIPLSDTLKSKLSVAKKDQDGYGTRLGTGEDQGGTDSLSGRMQLLWTPSENFNVHLTLDGVTQDERSYNGVLLDTNPFAFAPLLASIVEPTLPLIDAFESTSRFDNYADDGTNDLDAWGISATAEWRINDALTAKSITAYRDVNHLFGGDDDLTPLPIFSIVFGSKQNQFSQELQLLGESFDNRFNWMAGVYYFTENAASNDPIGLVPGLFEALEALPGPLPFGFGGAGNPANLGLDLSFDLFNSIDTESVAVFGQGTFDITDQFSITGGLRFTDESKDYFIRSFHGASQTVALPPTTRENDGDKVTFRVGAEYKWSQDLMTYVSVSSGFKSGGFNGRPQTIEELTSFDQETVTSYELGLKSALWNQRLRLNTALFFTDYNNLQLQSFQETATGFVSVVENAGKAEILGGEAELTLLPSEGWVVRYSVGYLDDDITQLDPLVTSVDLDSDLPRTPTWNMSGSIEYTHNFLDLGALKLGGNWSYRTAQTSVPTLTTDPLGRIPGYSLFGARATFVPRNGNWALSFFGTNLADKGYFIERIGIGGFSGTSIGRYGRPREWGISFTMTSG